MTKTLRILLPEEDARDAQLIAEQPDIVPDVVISESEVAPPRWRTRSALWRYGFALLAVVVAALLMMGWQRFVLEPAVAPFLAAILLTGWYAGVGPVVLATLLAVLTLHLVFLPPLRHIAFDGTSDLRLVWFLAFACLAAWFSAARRRAAEALGATRQELEERVAARTAELRRSEESLLAAQRLSHTGSWAWRIATGDISLSEECARILGRDPAVTTFNRQLDRPLWHPDDWDLAEKSIDAALREKRSFEIQARVVRRDGSTRNVRTGGRPVFDEAGEVVEFIGIMMDVTDRKRAARKLRRVRERVLRARFEAKLDERTRLARELHDTLLQGFTGVGLRLVAVANRMDGPPEIVAALRDVIATARRTLADARRAVWDMRSPACGGGDFAARLRAAAENGVRGSGIALECVIQDAVSLLPPDVEAVVLRVVQEAIANSVQHAAARSVRLTLACGPRRLRLSVADDGRGFTVDPDFRAYQGHWGLLGMRERASQIHGRLSVRSTPGRGTEIVLVTHFASTAQPEPPAPAA
jgi:PAS domain S-box-containing protein